VRRGAALAAGLAFAAVFLIFDYKIASRYLGRGEAAWTDELCVVLFIWIVFTANALVLRDREQITFDLLYAPAPVSVKRWMAVGRHVLIGGLFLLCLPATADYLLFLWRERTPVLGWRLDWVYACFILFMASVIVRAVWAVVGLLRPGWRERV
jgi:TRAP-type C4-dicarboxylate transport system permease small subunit